ncbi:hypothetical protein GA0070560_12671 [Micromonospora halophytica]|uniref:Uncharacterized protein n=2 Tax=Micromonospora halophytica TaxID=47864 RepID=A0A1C5JBE0_9ACTN|nr:hypothetical protein GA0070560_12671 [Micromonospora halophytica]
MTSCPAGEGKPLRRRSGVAYRDAMDPSAVWRDKNHRWRIEAYRVPDLRFAIFATNGTTESAPLWLFGMSALARWLMTHAISLDDLETD